MGGSSGSSQALLPQGLIDYLPDEAERRHQAARILEDCFAKAGYRRVDPPLVEYESSLFAEDARELSLQSFRLMDPISQKMMAIRADMTGQVARLADSRMADHPVPLRLTYTGQVLRVRGSQLQPDRQMTQLGCELIAPPTIETDCELVLLALRSLSALGLKGLTLDLLLPPLVPALLEYYGLAGDQAARALSVIAQKDQAAVQEVLPDPAAGLVLSLLDAGGDIKRAKERLQKIKLPVMQDSFQAFMNLADHLQKETSRAGFTLSLDLCERRGFDYHIGPAFALFADGLRGEAGRGGRYATPILKQPAMGFSLYLESLIIPPIFGTPATSAS